MKPKVFFMSVGVLLLACSPGRALVITLNYDATIAANFGADANKFKAAGTTAALELTSRFSDPINITIDVTTANLGFNQITAQYFNIGYAALRAAAVADAKSADDTTAIGAGGSLTVANPNVNNNWFVTRAQRKALGIAANDLLSDGTSQIDTGVSYDFDPSDGIDAGKYDLVGIMMHEFTEIMGRTGLSGKTLAGAVSSQMLLDAFSYTAAGTKGLTNGAGNYFSIDGGTTNLKAFNDNAANGGDSRDWAIGVNDSFNAFQVISVVNPLTAVDLRAVDVVGYDLSAPEPSAGVFVLLGGLVALRRKRRF